MEEKTIRSETLNTVIMSELVNDRKKFIFTYACSKLSHVNRIGSESGLARISSLNLREFAKTKKNGRK
jgi:hypothetical protein